MKIGILTFHKSINYGSVLQAWATMNLLEKEGYDVEICDYEPKSLSNLYNLYLNGKGIKTIIKNMLRMPIIKYKRNQQKQFENFRNDFLKLSDFSLTVDENYSILEKKYDCIFCGSDQIWNVHAADCDDIFFLPNVGIKKIGWSVSINNTDFTEPRCNSELKNWISDFDFISCREESGTNKIKSFIGNNHEVFTFLDPTLMHAKEDYYPICNERIIDVPYIFLYKVWSGKDSFKIVSKLGEKLNMPVYTLFMYSNILAMCKVQFGGINVVKMCTSPKDYLSLIKYAEYVITDSFHGTAFSLIFEKKFLCVKERNSDGKERQDERINNILSVLGLTERYVNIDDISNYPIMTEIEYQKVTERRLKIASDNINMIKKVLGE